MSTIDPPSPLAPTPTVQALALDQVLTQNDIFETEPGVRFRYLLGEADANVAHVIALQGDTPMPQQWQLDALVEAIKSREYRKFLAQGLAAAYIDPTEADASHGARRYGYIKDLIATPAILYRKGRGKRIEEQAAKLDISPQTLVSALRDYWLGGQTKDALLTSYAEGARKRAVSLVQAQSKPKEASGPEQEKQKTKTPKSRGRKRRDTGTHTGQDDGDEEKPSNEPYLLIGDERIRLRDEIVDQFLVKKTVTRKMLHRSVMTTLYSVVGADGKPKLLPPHQRPSRKQTSTLLDSALKLSQKVIHYTSKAEWENNSRPITGTLLQHAIGAGYVYEIDSTIVDLWLVARDNRSKIIGKATLYLVVDRYTRLIVGFHLTLDKPSWAGAMEALLSVVGDKRALCERYGAAYRPEVWVAHGIVPFSLAADRGSEYLGHESDQIAEDVRINVVNMPAHMSCLKGIVECTFKLVHVTLKETAPGYEPPRNAFKRHGDKCYERDAEYTLDELTAEFIDIIALHNLRMHQGMQLDPELVMTTRPIPVEVWAKDIERRGGQLRSLDESFMRHKLLPRKNAVVRQEGIYVNKCFYTCPEAFEDEWFVRAGKSGRFPVQVTYDRRSVNHIYIHNGKRGPVPYRATLSPRSAHYTNYSVGEVYAVESVRDRVNKQAAEHNLQLEVEHDHESAKRAARAHELAQAAIAAAAGQSRKTGAPELRAEEAGQRNGETAFPDAAGTAPTAATPDSVPQPMQPVPSAWHPSAAPVAKPKPPSVKRKPAAKAVALTPSAVPANASTSDLLNDFFNSDD